MAYFEKLYLNLPRGTEKDYVHIVIMVGVTAERNRSEWGTCTMYKVRSVGNQKSCIKNRVYDRIIVCRVCEVGDLELPIDVIGTPAARIGTWETVRQDGGALATVH